MDCEHAIVTTVENRIKKSVRVLSFEFSEAELDLLSRAKADVHFPTRSVTWFGYSIREYEILLRMFLKAIFF